MYVALTLCFFICSVAGRTGDVGILVDQSEAPIGRCIRAIRPIFGYCAMPPYDALVDCHNISQGISTTTCPVETTVRPDTCNGLICDGLCETELVAATDCLEPCPYFINNASYHATSTTLTPDDGIPPEWNFFVPLDNWAGDLMIRIPITITTPNANRYFGLGASTVRLMAISDLPEQINSSYMCTHSAIHHLWTINARNHYVMTVNLTNPDTLFFTAFGFYANSTIDIGPITAMACASGSVTMCPYCTRVPATSFITDENGLITIVWPSPAFIKGIIFKTRVPGTLTHFNGIVRNVQVQDEFSYPFTGNQTRFYAEGVEVVAAYLLTGEHCSITLISPLVELRFECEPTTENLTCTIDTLSAPRVVQLGQGFIQLPLAQCIADEILHVPWYFHNSFFNETRTLYLESSAYGLRALTDPVTSAATTRNVTLTYPETINDQRFYIDYAVLVPDAVAVETWDVEFSWKNCGNAYVEATILQSCQASDHITENGYYFSGDAWMHGPVGTLVYVPTAIGNIQLKIPTGEWVGVRANGQQLTRVVFEVTYYTRACTDTPPCNCQTKIPTDFYNVPVRRGPAITLNNPFKLIPFTLFYLFVAQITCAQPVQDPDLQFLHTNPVVQYIANVEGAIGTTALLKSQENQLATMKFTVVDLPVWKKQFGHFPADVSIFNTREIGLLPSTVTGRGQRVYFLPNAYNVTNVNFKSAAMSVYEKETVTSLKGIDFDIYLVPDFWLFLTPHAQSTVRECDGDWNTVRVLDTKFGGEPMQFASGNRLVPHPNPFIVFKTLLVFVNASNTLRAIAASYNVDAVTTSVLTHYADNTKQYSVDTVVTYGETLLIPDGNPT